MDELLERVKRLDADYVMQTYRRLPVAFVRGRGTRMWDSSGNEYLDMVGGLGVTVLGHCHPAVTEAICAQASRLIHTTNLYYVESQAELAKMLVERTFPGAKCFFANSGAEANEGALKLARKHHLDKGVARSKVVCLTGAFHGRTLATLSATGQPLKWAPFSPVVPGFVHVPPNDRDALSEAVDDQTAAVILEPVQGESGVHVLDESFLRAAREACDRVGAILIADEVQSGMGRTGTFYAMERSGVTADVVTIAKGLANGVPAAAFLARGEFGDVLTQGDHGTTFGGGFLTCEAARATLSAILDGDFVSNAEKVGSALDGRLRSMMDDIPAISEVRGRGLMLAVQLDRDVAHDVVLRCMEKGVLVNDVSPGVVRMLPALILTEQEAMTAADALEQALVELTN
ncbi:MAG: aspartate aminotransferase family protein [Candidatus Anoxymicrobium japonicum]|uniref:Acetylornithine aminotransferase n=1 Tax=Candidatus Anoxymicrobium japonicum TaxID=2013648 RepID=A0A2N3G8G4_9ACTN|nr:MAG: aspartate aminotransferase family protein [Candidatus Anoxymicrobium japonicum]